MTRSSSHWKRFRRQENDHTLLLPSATKNSLTEKSLWLDKEKRRGKTTARGASPTQFVFQKEVVLPLPTFRTNETATQFFSGTTFSREIKFFHQLDVEGGNLALDQSTSLRM
jgi:hypothetical protein